MKLGGNIWAICRMLFDDLATGQRYKHRAHGHEHAEKVLSQAVSPEMRFGVNKAWL